LEELVLGLAPYEGAIGTQEVADARGDTDIWGATFAVESPTLRQAVTTALNVIEELTSVKAVGVEVLPAEKFARRVLRPSIPELVGFAEIADMADVSRQRARQLADLPNFPIAVVKTSSGPLRVRRQVEAWLGRWERKRGDPDLSRLGRVANSRRHSCLLASAFAA
jgi:hypothetical protein